MKLKESAVENRHRDHLGNARNAAFTLLELLLVLTLMTALLSLASFAFPPRGKTVALQSAQAVLAGECRRVSSLAVLHQSRIRLLISAGDAGHRDRLLRSVQLAYEWPADSGHWQTEGAVTIIPSAIAIVPPIVAPTLLADGVSWPSGPDSPVSRLSGPEAITIDGAAPQNYYFFEVTPGGGLEPRAPQIALATIRNLSVDSFRFDNSSAVRGVRVRANGVVDLLTDARDF